MCRIGASSVQHPRSRYLEAHCGPVALGSSDQEARKRVKKIPVQRPGWARKTAVHPSGAVYKQRRSSLPPLGAGPPPPPLPVFLLRPGSLFPPARTLLPVVLAARGWLVAIYGAEGEARSSRAACFSAIRLGASRRRERMPLSSSWQ